MSGMIRFIKISCYELGPAHTQQYNRRGDCRSSLIWVLETGMGIGNVPCGIGHIKPAENSADSLLIRSGTALNTDNITVNPVVCCIVV